MPPARSEHGRLIVIGQPAPDREREMTRLDAIKRLERMRDAAVVRTAIERLPLPLGNPDVADSHRRDAIAIQIAINALKRKE